MLGMVWRISSNTAETGSSLPRQAHALRDLLDDPQVLARVAGRIDRLAAQLHEAVGVGEGAGLLGEGAGRQDHVGEVRGLGEEDVLHDQVLELRRAPRARGSRRGRDIAGFSPMMYMPRTLPALIACITSTTVRPGLSSSVPAGRPQALSKRARAAALDDALVVGDTSSGSGRRRTRPGRCSGRAADAGRCRAGRSGRSSATARSGSARCRCRARAARCPCPTGSSTRCEVAYRRATSRIVSASMPQIGAIASGL